MTKRTVLPLTVLVVMLSAIGWAAWTRWPPLLEYRIRDIEQRTLGVVEDYLDGRRALEPSASALAVLWQRKLALSLHLPPAGRIARIADPLSTRLGARADDPRLRELVDRALELTMGPEARARLQYLQRERRDST